MQRKWIVLAVTVISGLALTASFSSADDDDSPFKKLMEQIQSKSTAVTKGTRKEVDWKKKQKDVAKAADELVDLAKKAKDMGAEGRKNAKTVNNAEPKWNGFMDDFIKSAGEMSKVAARTDAKYDDAVAARKAITKSCADCHGDFRGDE